MNNVRTGMKSHGLTPYQVRIILNTTSPDNVLSGLEMHKVTMSAFLTEESIRFCTWVTKAVDCIIRVRKHQESRPDIFPKWELRQTALRNLLGWGRLTDKVSMHGRFRHIYMHIETELLRLDCVQ